MITHGPPLGLRDPVENLEDRTRAPLLRYRGCASLRQAVASARPRLVVFGHNHPGWGSTVVNWKETDATEPCQIDLNAPGAHPNEASREELQSLDKINALRAADEAGKQAIKQEGERLAAARAHHTTHLAADRHPLAKGKQTLLVNTAIETLRIPGEQHEQWPFVVDMDLPAAPAAPPVGPKDEAWEKPSGCRVAEVLDLVSNLDLGPCPTPRYRSPHSGAPPRSGSPPCSDSLSRPGCSSGGTRVGSWQSKTVQQKRARSAPTSLGTGDWRATAGPSPTPSPDGYRNFKASKSRRRGARGRNRQGPKPPPPPEGKWESGRDPGDGVHGGRYDRRGSG